MASSSKRPRLCTFTDVLRIKYPLLKEGRDPSEVYCTICDCYFSIKFKGASDIEKHIQSQKHKKQALTVSKNVKIDSIFQNQSVGNTAKISAAESTLALHTVNHHHSFRSMDCTSVLLKTIFPDSNIAQGISCARTKTEAIVTGVITPWVLNKIQQSLESIECIGVSTDASNHGAEKIFPILIQFFDWQEGITTKVLDVMNTRNETAETITEIIKSTLQKYDLLEKCVSYTADNANVNFGGVNRQPGQNVWTRIKNILGKEIVGVGCPAHILHNCIQRGTDVLTIDLESLVMKLFNYFSVYTVRTEALKDICEYIDVNYEKLLSHSKTRWLSLFPAVDRILKMYEPLKEYFLTTPAVPMIIKKFFENELAEIYLFMVHSLMAAFQENILEIEKECNSVLDIARILDTMRAILSARARSNFKPLKVRELLDKCSGHNQELFDEDVKNMYKICIDYLDSWMKPLDDFKVFNWMIVKKGEEIDFDNTVAAIHYMNGKGVHINDVKLFDEITALNTFLMLQENAFFDAMLHTIWVKIFKSIGVARLQELLRICQYLFAITAQNANVERIFSLMGVQWTKERNRLTVSSVRALLLTQYNLKTLNCISFYELVIKDKTFLSEVSKSSKYVKKDEC